MIPHFIHRLPLCCLCAASLLPLTSHAQTVFSDSTFNVNDYQSSIIRDTSPSHTGNFNVFQINNGGDPGFYLEVNFTLPYVQGQGTQEVWVGHLLKTGIYTPSTQGAIADIALKLDSNFFSQNAGVGLTTGILVEQNSLFYAYQMTQPFILSGTGWHPMTLPATAGPSAAVLFNGVGFSGHPDFSSSGAPIDFGFYEEIGAGAGASINIQANTGEDNWSVTIDSMVPEASTWVISALASAVLAFQVIRASLFSRRQARDSRRSS